ncbi:protein kinase [Trypanosoma theileri]|uniref:non-specific serine/threonine protein kinase n=1 Tax=Trypanosoma theileri TaxID=67003 RepID=A0A1X0PA45_9TRYP|nr:protein kinase [Trypanosoma theileri]ORC93701.1 protein kinase [Trypanosoma theileri]
MMSDIDDARDMLIDAGRSRKRTLQTPSFYNNIPHDDICNEEEREGNNNSINNNNNLGMPAYEQVDAEKWSKPNGATPPRRKTGPKVAQTRVTVGMRLKRWIITGRIGAGSFGETFTAVEANKEGEGDGEGETAEDVLVPSHDGTLVTSGKQEVCIKVEQDDKNVLRVEAAALKKMQPCSQVVRYLGSGSTGGLNFLVMQRLGSNLAELRRGTQSGTFSTYTTLRVGISCLKAIQGIHDLGLVHRDIKPSNFVIGLGGSSDPRVCYLIDFGLARRYRRVNGEVRPPRENAGFRGTSRYASLASHHQQELGRVDDIWSLLFMLIEFATGTLPWRKYKEKEDIGRCKEEVIGPGLVQNLPREFRPFLAHLQTLRYEDEPSYDFLLSLMERAIERRGYPPNKHLDWEPEEESGNHVDPHDDSSLAICVSKRSGGGGGGGEGVSVDKTPIKSVTAENPSLEPLVRPTVPAPVAVNMDISAPVSAVHLMRPSLCSEDEEERCSRVRVSDVNLSSAMPKIDTSNHDTPFLVKTDKNSNTKTASHVHHVPSTPLNQKFGKSISEEQYINSGIHNQVPAITKEDQISVEDSELVDIGIGFSPREGDGSVANGKPKNGDISPPPEWLMDTMKPQHGPESPDQNQGKEQQTVEIGKKRVSFALNVDVADEAARGAPKTRKESKQEKKKAKCKCNIM